MVGCRQRGGRAVVEQVVIALASLIVVLGALDWVMYT